MNPPTDPYDLLYYRGGYDENDMDYFQKRLIGAVVLYTTALRQLNCMLAFPIIMTFSTKIRIDKKGRQSPINYFDEKFVPLWIDAVMSIPELILSIRWATRLALRGKIDRFVDFSFTFATAFDVVMDIVSAKLCYNYYLFASRNDNETVRGYRYYILLFFSI